MGLNHGEVAFDAHGVEVDFEGFGFAQVAAKLFDEQCEAGRLQTEGA